MVRIVGKKRRAGAEAWTPKDKDMRIVPVPKVVQVVLTKLHAEAEIGRAYVFVNGKGPDAGGRIKRQNMWRDFQAIRRRAGVPPCSMYDLRKSYCTNLAGSVPMHVLQELAGHSDIRTTRRYYVKVQPELMDTARCAVDTALGSCR